MSKSSSVRKELVVRCAADIVPRNIEWLWPDRIALGKLTLEAGHPGLGKTQLALHLAAQVSTGGAWPNGEGYASEGSVILLSVEDDPEDTTVPRLMAAGANLDKIDIVDAVRVPSANGSNERQFNISDDVQALCDHVDARGDVRLVIIDPISAYLGDGKKVDSHKNTEVRAALAPLQARAAEHGFAILGISHLNKGSGQEAIMRVLDSTAFVAAARAVYLLVSDTKDQRTLFINVKNNVGKNRPGLAFRPITKIVAGNIETSAIEWDADEITLTADEALAAAANKGRGRESNPGALEEAMEFLTAILKDGPKASTYLLDQAESAGISITTLRRAKQKLSVEACYLATIPEWRWKLPEPIILRSHAND